MNAATQVPGGRVVAVRDAIVDVAFDRVELPLIEQSMSIMDRRSSRKCWLIWMSARSACSKIEVKRIGHGTTVSLLEPFRALVR